MISRIITTLFVFSITFSFAQHDDHSHSKCGTSITAEQVQKSKGQKSDWKKFQNAKTTVAADILQFPVQVHIIAKSDGSGQLSNAEYTEMFERLNELYFDARIQFYFCGAWNYINDDNYYLFNDADENALAAAHEVSDVINIYFAKDVYEVNGSDTSYFCGYAYFSSSSRDRVLMDIDCAVNGSTLAHELGHYFDLYHTHQTSFGLEHVNGSNCATAGDRLCDTPADPQIGGSNVDNDGCIYFGTDLDPNSELYNPDVTNIMSYAPRECRFSFSPDQLAKIRFTAENSRQDLVCLSAVALDADFKSDVQETCNNTLSVDFFDVSAGTPTIWNWDFGDGSGTSTNQYPTYNYTTPGTYTVTLTANNGAPDVEAKTQYIKVGPTALPYSQDFEGGASALGDFHVEDRMKNYTSVEAGAANASSFGLLLQGFDGSSSPYYRTPDTTEAFQTLWNNYYKSRLDLCIDATNVVTVDVSFDIKQIYYANNNYTNFRALINGVPITKVFQPAGSNTVWETINMELDQYAGTTFTLTLEATNKYSRDYNGVEDGNATYIDNINITGVPTGPTPPVAEFDPNRFLGCTNSPFVFTDDSHGSITTYSWDFGAGANPPTANGVGPHQVTYSTAGTKTIQLILNDPLGDDTATAQVEVYGGSVSIPYTEDFESFANCATTTNCGTTVCNLTNDWLNLNTDDHDWRTDDNGTTSTSTGPTTDHNPGTTAGNYLYLEASGSCYGAEAVVLSPCIDLTGASAPSATLWYHMYGDDMGSLQIDVIHEGGVDNADFYLAGDQGNIWERAVIYLGAYNDQVVKLRIKGVTGNGFHSDMAIDDFWVGEAPFDCNGDSAGTAFIDSCGFCAGGNTGVTPILNPGSCITGTQVAKDASLLVYPNPSEGSFNVILQRESKITVVDANGKVIETIAASAGRTELGAGLSSGIYHLIVVDDEGINTETIVKY